MKKDDTENLLTRRQAAARLGIGLTKLDIERRCGHLEYIQMKDHGKVLIPESAIRDYLDKGRRNAPKSRGRKKKR